MVDCTSFQTAGPLQQVCIGYPRVHDDTRGIVKQALVKDDGVEFWIDPVSAEDDEDGGIRSNTVEPKSEDYISPTLSN